MNLWSWFRWKGKLKGYVFLYLLGIVCGIFISSDGAEGEYARTIRVHWNRLLGRRMEYRSTIDHYSVAGTDHPDIWIDYGVFDGGKIQNIYFDNNHDDLIDEWWCFSGGKYRSFVLYLDKNKDELFDGCFDSKTGEWSPFPKGQELGPASRLSREPFLPMFNRKD